MRLLRTRSRFFPALVLLATLASCNRPREADPRVISEWMRALYGIVRAERLSPPVASRLFAYSSVALYSGLVANDASRPSLAGKLNGLTALPQPKAGEHYDPTIMATTATRVVLDSLFREGMATTRSAVNHLSDSIETAQEHLNIGAATVASSRELGRLTGLAIVKWAHGDGFDSTRGHKYEIPAGKGLWVNDTPLSNYSAVSVSAASQLVQPDNPSNLMKSANTSDRALIIDRQKLKNATLPAANMAGVTEPFWGSNRPFALARWDACEAPPPPAYSEDPTSDLYKEAKVVFDTHAALTPDQKTTALYWADNGGESGTPAGHWLNIGAQMIAPQRMSAPDAAWMMVATSASLADAFIASWGYKFRHNLIRPRTYIRITMDSTWEPTIPTPPFPEYLSGHSTVSSAAAATLTAVLGPVAFDDSTSLFVGHDVRHFANFADAASQAGMSRIYGGIHFPSGNVNGQALGRCIATAVVKRMGITPRA